MIHKEDNSGNVSCKYRNKYEIITKEKAIALGVPQGKSPLTHVLVCNKNIFGNYKMTDVSNLWHHDVMSLILIFFPGFPSKSHDLNRANVHTLKSERVAI